MSAPVICLDIESTGPQPATDRMVELGLVVRRDGARTRLRWLANPGVRVWIRESEWDALSDDARDDLEEPLEGHPIAWEGVEGFVRADVPDDELLTTLRGMTEAALVTLHEGEEPPPPAKTSKKKGSKKAAVAAPAAPADDPLAPGQRTLRVGDAVWGRFPNAQYTVAEIDDATVLLRDDSIASLTRRVPREWITLDAADLWRFEIPVLDAPPEAAVPIGAIVFFKHEADPDGGDHGYAVERISNGNVFFENAYFDDNNERVTASWSVPIEAIRIEDGRWRSARPIRKALFQTTPDDASPIDPPAVEVATVTLRVKRGDWLLHRSELRDSAGAVLHKRWEPIDQDRVVTVERGAEVVSIVVRYCTANNIALWLNDVQVAPKSDAAPVAPAKPTKRAAKGGAK